MSTSNAENRSAENNHYDSHRPYSEAVAKSEFPRSVNWGNPRVAAILEAAAHCFSSRGFTATTLADIGKELGLRKSIVHYYFASKTSLIQEVQSFAYGRYLQVIQSALAPSTLEQLEVVSGVGESSAYDSADARDSGFISKSRLVLGLRSLWTSLSDQGAMRGLNLELWSEGRRDEELSLRAQTLEAEAHRLLKDHMLSSSRSNMSAEQAEDMATLTLAVLDGLHVREEREGAGPRTARAFETFLGLLEKKSV